MTTEVRVVSEVRTFTTTSGRPVYILNGQSGFDLDALVAACHDASCRPPTSGGTGGSRKASHAGFPGMSAPRERGEDRPIAAFHKLTHNTMDALDIPGDDSERASIRAEKFIGSWYDATLPGGYKITNLDSARTGDSFYVTGEIRTLAGRKVGSFERSISVDPERIVVWHEEMYLDDSAQGKGIAQALNAHSMEQYQKWGVDHVHVDAGASVGGYAWAAAGFRIDDQRGETRHQAILGLGSRAGMRLDQMMQRGEITPEAYHDLNRKLDALLKASKDGEDIQPVHIASLGEGAHNFTKEATVYRPAYETWPGKEMLLGADWSGDFYLTRTPITASITINFGESFTMTEHLPAEDGDIDATRDWVPVHAAVDEIVDEFGEPLIEPLVAACYSAACRPPKSGGRGGSTPGTTVVHAVQGALDDSLRRAPWKGSSDPMAGHCYVAAEAVYHMLGGKASGYTPMFIRHEGSPHWYLRNKSGKVLDPTASQFHTPVPYDQGKGKGFLTSEPSKRAQTVIERAHKSLGQ